MNTTVEPFPEVHKLVQFYERAVFVRKSYVVRALNSNYSRLIKFKLRKSK